MLRRLRAARKAWPRPYVTALADETRDPFRVLIACLLSLRTRDETTADASTRLFGAADNPEAMVRLGSARISKLIYPVGFYKTKAKQIIDICRQLDSRFDGEVPDDIEELITLPGVGRKTANLVRTEGFGKPGICVDIHVHRISNRWGLVDTKTPDKTEIALRECLPRRYWIEFNDLLVAFGQQVCRPTSPICSSCPVAADCPRIGVSRSR